MTHRQPDLFAPPRKPRAARKAEGDRLITRRELRASLALYSPTGTADPDALRRDRVALGIEQHQPKEQTA